MAGGPVTTIVRGPRPPELEAWLQRRRRLGLDRRDEVWEGRYVVAPDPHSNHGEVQLALGALLRPAARRLGLQATATFNLGGPDDFRVPDAGLVPRPAGVWHDTAALVVEILSPDDQTFDKLDFYTAHGVQELLVLDWRDRSVRCFALQEGQREMAASAVLDLATSQITSSIDWPPLTE
jgi:Uma2 family endonuclease